jgi:hypothetical protein
MWTALSSVPPTASGHYCVHTDCDTVSQSLPGMLHYVAMSPAATGQAV